MKTIHSMKAAILPLVALLLAVAGLHMVYYGELFGEEYRVFPSPNGRYQVVVRRARWFALVPVMSGQGGMLRQMSV